MGSMICPTCECGCLIVPYSCLYGCLSQLKDLGIEKRPELLNDVNNFALIGETENDGLLGWTCFNAMCTAIKKAETAAATYREANPDEGDNEQASYQYHLDDIWNDLINNGQFQLMYANYLMYYYYATLGASASSTLDGDVTKTRAPGVNEGIGSTNVDIAHSMKQAATYKKKAQAYTSIFKRTYWESNKEKYDCGRSDADCDPVNPEGEYVKTPIRKKSPRWTAV